MFKLKLILSNLYYKTKKILFVTILCLSIASILVTPRTTPKKIFLSEEEALINFALDHNQCLSYGHIPDTFDYFNCMEKLHKQRQSVATI